MSYLVYVVVLNVRVYVYLLYESLLGDRIIHITPIKPKRVEFLSIFENFFKIWPKLCHFALMHTCFIELLDFLTMKLKVRIICQFYVK